MAALSLTASMAFGLSKTGELACILSGAGAEAYSNRVDILQNADGSGGVATVDAEGLGIKCGASGMAKFGKKVVFEVKIVTKSGEVIKSLQNNSDSGMLQYGDDVLCTCMVLETK